jgi:hypothetical protein
MSGNTLKSIVVRTSIGAVMLIRSKTSWLCIEEATGRRLSHRRREWADRGQLDGANHGSGSAGSRHCGAEAAEKKMRLTEDKGSVDLGRQMTEKHCQSLEKRDELSF